MREQYDSLNDDDGPFHVEAFPWRYAAPERELLLPDSKPEFRNITSVDPKIEGLLFYLCSGQWA